MKKSTLFITLFMISLFWVFNAQAQTYQRTGSVTVTKKTKKEVSFFICANATYGWAPGYKFEYQNSSSYSDFSQTWYNVLAPGYHDIVFISGPHKVLVDGWPVTLVGGHGVYHFYLGSSNTRIEVAD